MKVLQLTSQFKKDLKRYKNHRSTLDQLERILDYLENGEDIPKEYKPHTLTGDYRGYMECHVENDTLLIWLDRDTEIITLVRFGSHSELFGKGKKR